jgi:Glutamine amidotransferases class-II
VCEILAAAWPEPRPLSVLLPYVRKMERLGLAGFGWGVAWLAGQSVVGYRRPTTLASDRSGRDELASVASTRFLIHLRRPSRLSTTRLADTQPFVESNGAFAFCHNGSFRSHERYRDRFAGRLRGQADSEVGFRLFEELLPGLGDPARGLREVARRLGGNANLGYLGADGRLLVRSGHRGNLVWRFRVEEGQMAATELHSRDDSLFDLVFSHATERYVVEDVADLHGATVARVDAQIP